MPPPTATALVADRPAGRQPDAAPAARSPFAPPAATSHPGHSPVVAPAVRLRATAPWRFLAGASVLAVFAGSGVQVMRVADGRTRSPMLLALVVAAWVVAAVAVLVWTYLVTDNARGLVSPAVTSDLPDPWKAVSTWALPMVFLSGAAVLIVVLSWTMNTPDENPSSVPLAIAVLSILLAIPVASRPFHYLARVVRQVGGRSTDLLQWMWVSVALGVVGVAVIAGLRAGGAFEATDELAPMWVVGVVAIVPSVVVLFLAWGAAVSVEDAVAAAADRRRSLFSARSVTGGRAGVARAGSRPATTSSRRRGRPGPDLRGEVRQMPGADVLRFTIVVGLAGLALLGVVSAAVMFLFWMETRDGGVLPSQRERAWEVLGTFRIASWFVGLGIGALVSIWTFVAVLNVRLASGRRRNPLIAALSWPAVGLALWALADRLDSEESATNAVLLLAVQAVTLYIPFLLLERAALAVDARRTPLRITYGFTMVLFVYTEALVTLSEVTDTVTSVEFGRLAGFLALGAVVLLLSTLAVTEACSSITLATEYEADLHNELVAQRRQIDTRAVRPDPIPAS